MNRAPASRENEKLSFACMESSTSVKLDPLPDFTLFSPKIDNAAFVAETSDPVFADDLGQSHLRAEAPQSATIVFAQLEGGKARDVNRSGLHVGAPIVSPRFLKVLAAHSLSGWTSYPIQLSDKTGAALTGFAVLGVSGRCGPIDDELSELVIARPPVATGRASKMLKGLHFDPESWDGSDFSCSTDGSLHTFLSPKAVDALTATKLTGFDLKPSAELLRSWRASGGFV